MVRTGDTITAPLSETTRTAEFDAAVMTQ